jgi:hypothetical protein
MVVITSTAMGPNAVAGNKPSKPALSSSQRAEVETIVNTAKTELSAEIHKNGSKLDAIESMLKKLSSSTQSPAKSSSKAKSKKAKGKIDVDGYLQNLVDEAEECEDRERFQKALKRLIDGDDCGKSGSGWGRSCDYKDSKGKIDLNKLIECEIQHQLDLEDRENLRKAFKRLLSDDECKTECKTSGVSYSSTNYCPPGYAPVVIEPGPPPYWRYVNCD